MKGGAALYESEITINTIKLLRNHISGILANIFNHLTDEKMILSSFFLNKR